MSAANVVKRLEGVTAVSNDIEVLPLSPFDDGIRLRVARAIYVSTSLSRYSLGTQPAVQRRGLSQGIAAAGQGVADDMGRCQWRRRGQAAVHRHQRAAAGPHRAAVQ